MDQTYKKRKLAEQIKALFKMGPVVLILGRHCEKELNEQLLKLDWNCVITSNRKQELAAMFAIENKRMPINITKLENIEKSENKIVDRKNLSIIRLNGIEGLNDGEDVGKTDRARRAIRRSTARKMLDYLPSIIGKQFGWVIIVGYDPFDDEDIDQNDLYTALEELGQPIVRFFGINEQTEKDSTIGDLVKDKIAKAYNYSISEILSLHDDDDDEIIYTQRVEGKSIFIDGRVIPIDSELTFETEGFAQLLTSEEIRRIVLRKKGEQREWFYNFLKLSVEKPQWYGYSHTSDFHLHRYFENDLFKLVEARLANYHLPDRIKGSAGKEENASINQIEGSSIEVFGDKIDITSEKKAILLCGHPCSSKTISLGALAYKVFNDKKHPVVFINNPDINLSQNSSAFAALDKLLEKLENLGASNVLLIWDCSSYNNLGNSPCKRLNDTLLNRGRKVVLVCSSYEQPSHFYKDEKSYNKEGSIVQVRNFYVIKTSQELTEREHNDLKNLVAEKSGIDRNSLENYWNSPKNSTTNLLTRLYTIIYTIHPQLEYGLNREYNVSINSIKKMLSEMPQIKQNKTNMALALEDVGIRSEFGEENEKNKLDWEYFTNVIAIFSRFKLETPVTLAMQALNLPLNSNNTMIYQKIMDMPWLTYHTSGMDEYSGDYMFSFRSSLEAEIYLNNSGIDATSQIEHIAKLLDYIGKDNRGSRAQFSTSVQKLEKFIRIIGPNSDNVQLVSGSLKADYKAFQAGYPALIKALEKLRVEYNYDDSKLINQEVTFIREYYFRIYDSINPSAGDNQSNINNYIDRINKINGAIITANKEIDKLNTEIRNISRNTTSDKSFYYSQIGLRNSLIVECIFCDLRVRELRKRLIEQLKLANENAEVVKDTISKVKIKVEPFSIVKDRLLDVIYTNPTSSYAYSALFRKFLSEYEDNDLSYIEKMKYLSEMQSLIAEVDNNNNDVIYEDEYARPALLIDNYAQSNTGGVTIDNIDLPAVDKRDLFRNYYYALLKEKNASGVYLLADNARKKDGIDYRKPLTESQKASCNRIIDFLSREDYSEAVSQSSGCQYMLLRLKWMLYNNAPIFSGRECQLTCMTTNQWKEIASISKYYSDTFLKNGKNNCNAATIYYIIALSNAQLGDFEESYQAFNKISEESFYSQVRNKIWHILCKENGEPIKFTGEFDEENFDSSKRTGRAFISEVSRSRSDYIYYHISNLGWSSVHPGIHKDLEIGISYIGFSIFRAVGRMKRQ